MEVNHVGIEGVGNIATNDAMSVQTEKKVAAEYNQQVANPILMSANEVQGSTANGNEQKQNGEASKEHIITAVTEANKKIRAQNTRCEFQYHESTKRVSIKVVDKETEEVIKEIPPEETLEMVEKMWEMAGILVDEKR